MQGKSGVLVGALLGLSLVMTCALAPQGTAYAFDLDFDDIGWNDGGECYDCSPAWEDMGGCVDYCGGEVYGGCYADCYTYDGYTYCDIYCGGEYYGSEEYCDWYCYDDEYDYYGYDDYDMYEYDVYEYDYSYDSYSYPSRSSSYTPSYSYPVAVSSGTHYTPSYSSPTYYPVSVSSGVPSTTYNNIDNSVRYTDNSVRIDNSINNSFNTNSFNSGSIVSSNVNSPGVYIVQDSVVVTPLAVATPQYTIGYSYTNPTPVYAQASYAPVITTTYPHVALSQIPYTGFDLGPIGNALYWAALLSFAVAGAYLLVYYKGGVGTLMAALAGGYAQRSPIKVTLPVAAPAREEEKLDEALIKASASDRQKFTTDTMGFVQSKDGAPRIVILRE